MAQKKKNSNYVTEKTTAAKAAKAVAKKKEKTKKVILTCVSAFLSVAIIVGIIFAIGIPFGMLDYKPEVPEELHIDVGDYGEFRVGLFTNDSLACRGM